MAAPATRRAPIRLAPSPPYTMTPTPSRASATPIAPRTFGRSCPRAKPRSIPHNGGVAYIRAVLDALVRSTPKVKSMLFPPTPISPSAAMGRRSFRLSLPPCPQRRRKTSTKSPARVNRNATKGSGGIPSTAYLTATGLVPKKTAAESREVSRRKALFLAPSTTMDSTLEPLGVHLQYSYHTFFSTALVAQAALESSESPQGLA